MNQKPKALTILTSMLFVLAASATTGSSSAEIPVSKAAQSSKNEPGTANSDSPNSSQSSSEKAEAILKKVSEFYSKLQSFSVQLKINTLVKLASTTQPEIKIDADYRIKFKRPNRISVVQTGGTPIEDLHCDGKVATICSSEAKKYVLFLADPDIEKVIHDPLFRTGYGCLKDSALDALLFKSTLPWRAFSMAHVPTELSYEGVEKIDGESFDKLKVQGPRFEEFVYVGKGASPWIRRISSDDTNVADTPLPPGTPRMLSFSNTANYSQPEANPSLSDSSFKFKPPHGASRVDTLEPEEAPSPLLGKAEIDFSADLADGSKFTLSQLKKEKKAVLLDFWASWCGPCRRALPVVLSVAAEYKKKGVEFYSVNLQDQLEKVQNFLKDNNFSMNVIMDHDGSIGGHYRAEAIPMTVIIDRKGVIRAVHNGYSPYMERDLKRELDHALGIKNKIY